MALLIPPPELLPEDSPKLTHPSDHFGVELDIKLPKQVQALKFLTIAFFQV
jgi:hypothetical protein